MNILEQANQIVNHRSEEKEREYGPFNESMERAARLARDMTGKEFDVHMMFASMIALKLSRQAHSLKRDNLLDAAAYIGAWQNYIDDQQQSEDEQDQTVLEIIKEVQGHGRAL